MIRDERDAPRSWSAGRGFTLVEILVAITLIVLLMTFGVSRIQAANENARVVKCQDNLRQIGESLRLYKEMRNKGRWPKEGGMRFLLTLYRHREVPSGNPSRIFLCPGTDDHNDAGPSGLMGSSYDEWETLSSDSISYAGRDIQAFPISSAREGSEVIGADDNEWGPNHRTVTNLLYADGSVVAFDLFIDGADILALEPSYEGIGLPVGPESPYEPLQTLRVD